MFHSTNLSLIFSRDLSNHLNQVEPKLVFGSQIEKSKIWFSIEPNNIISKKYEISEIRIFHVKIWKSKREKDVSENYLQKIFEWHCKIFCDLEFEKYSIRFDTISVDFEWKKSKRASALRWLALFKCWKRKYINFLRNLK